MFPAPGSLGVQVLGSPCSGQHPAGCHSIKLCLEELLDDDLLTSLSACRLHSMQPYSKQLPPRPPKLPKLQPYHLHRLWLGRPCRLHSWRNRCAIPHSSPGCVCHLLVGGREVSTLSQGRSWLCVMYAAVRLGRSSLCCVDREAYLVCKLVPAQGNSKTAASPMTAELLTSLCAAAAICATDVHGPASCQWQLPNTCFGARAASWPSSRDTWRRSAGPVCSSRHAHIAC